MTLAPGTGDRVDPLAAGAADRQDLERLTAMLSSRKPAGYDEVRDAEAFLADSGGFALPGELLRDGVPREVIRAKFWGSEAGRNIRAQMDSGFSDAFAFAAWVDEKALHGLQRELTTRERPRSPDDVCNAREVLRLLSNASYVDHEISDAWRAKLHGFRPSDAKILKFFEVIETAADDGALLPQRELPSAIPVFTTRDGYTLRSFRERFRRDLPAAFKREDYPGLYLDLDARVIPWIDPTLGKTLVDEVQKERRHVLAQLTPQASAEDRAAAERDYDRFEEFFRILARRPTRFGGESGRGEDHQRSTVPGFSRGSPEEVQVPRLPNDHRSGDRRRP